MRRRVRFDDPAWTIGDEPALEGDQRGPIPGWFLAWFALCTLVGLGLAGAVIVLLLAIAKAVAS